MRKLLVLLLALIFAAPCMLRADVLTVYNGTSTNRYVPVYGLYADAYLKCQYVIPAADLTAMNGGEIQGLTFATSTSTASWTSTFQVYLTEVDYTSISSFIAASSATTVYTGTLSVSDNAITINFTTPYPYNGGNLLVGVDNITKGSYSSCSFFGTTVSGASVQGYNYSNYSSITPTQRDFIPATTFNYVIAGASTFVAVPELELGYRPNGYWMRPFQSDLINNGGYTTITAIDVSNSFFVLGEVELPATVHGGGIIPLEISTTEATAGDVTGQLVVMNDSRQATLLDMTAIAYDPVAPDVWEMAQVVTSFPYVVTYNAPSVPLIDNYMLPGAEEDGPDAVYKVTFAHDKLLNVTVTGENPKAAIYPQDFYGEGGPGVDNSYVMPTAAVSRLFEGFETGNFSAYEWTNDAAYPWTVTSGAFEGLYCAKCGNSGEGGSESGMTLNYEIPEDGFITFYWKFSGEGNSFDIPKFYIDGALVSPSSGLPSGGFDWTVAEYPVTAGPHTFTWAYKKDGSVNIGSDCMWVDNIAFVSGRETRENIADMVIPDGTYYIVASSTSDDFTVEINPVEIPVPEAPLCIEPVDGATNVTAPINLKWTFGRYTTEYQLVFGTTYPPTEILVDWTDALASIYRVESLLNNTTYFWRINERNSSGVTNGEVWGFTTSLNIPQALTAADYEIFEGENAVLSWTAVQNRSFRGYNVYQDGVKINDNPLTETSYAVSGLAYNMTGYDFNVTAVYDEGESFFSNTATVYVSGEGNVSGIVYEQDGVTPIAGVTVSFRGNDEFGDDQTYTYTTGANGQYSGALYSGVYEAVASVEGYQDKSYGEDVDIVYATMTPNIDFIMDEVYYPVAEVIAEEVDSSMVKVYWSMSMMSSIIEDFETGDFSAYEWNNSSSYPWEITTDNPYEGTYCMKSTCEGVAHGSSSIEITMDIDRDALMSFYGKISSENNYDKGKFYIDGTQQGAWSGAGSWTNREFHVTEGTHTFKWSYEKDGSVNSNDDCFYVDYINFCYDPEPFNGEAWLYYDDGTNVDAIGLTNGGSFYWGIMFPAAELGQYAGTSLTKVSYFDYAAHTGNILIYEGGASAPGTLVCTQPYTAAGTSQFVEFTLDTPVAVDATQNLWIVMNNDNGQYVAAAGANTGNPNGRWISIDGTQWDDVAALGLDYTWNLRGFVTNGRGATIALDNDRVVKKNAVDYVGKSTPNGVLTTDPDAVVTYGAQAPVTNERSFQYYNVWRTSCYNTEYTEENTVLLASHVTDTVHMDMSWANVQPGVYKWGVSRVYEGNRGLREEMTYDFEDGTLQGWTTIDADGDGNNFMNSNDLFGPGSGHNGSQYCVLSQSFVNYFGPLTPDNYLVSPQVTVGNGASISFYACGQDSEYAGEHYGVAVSTAGNTNAGDFTTIWEETMSSKSAKGGNAVRGTREQGTWYLKTVDLSAYAGQSIYVAIRHFDCTDMFCLDIDDITINTGGASGSNSVIGERESEIVWSECIDKDMYTTVDVTVSTNSGDAPAGTTVTLTNVSEPEMGYDYTVTLDETGYYAWDEFRKGTYLCTIAKEGYTGCYTEESMDIWDATSIECMLEEIIYGISDLYVSHTGWAMWEGNGGNSGPVPPAGSEFTYGFEGDLNADGWTIQQSDETTWVRFQTTGFGAVPHEGEWQMWLHWSYGNQDEWLITPEFTVPSQGNLNFWSYGFLGSTNGDHYYVKISTDGGSTWNELWDASSQTGGENHYDSAINVDLSAYAGQSAKLAWQGFANGGLWYAWCIDDITVSGGREIISFNGKKWFRQPVVATEPSGPSQFSKAGTENKVESRAIEEYKVMLDGVFEGNTTNNFFQHDVTNLIAGQEYTTSVAAVYATGMSDWSEYTWVYQPCEDYAGTVNGVTGEWNGADVELNWEFPESGVNPPIPPGPGDMATIVLEAYDVWGDGTGYNMLLDADATVYPDLPFGNFGGLIPNDIFNEMEYLIPEDANPNVSFNGPCVFNGREEIEIPAGTYDYVLVNPCPGIVYVVGSGGPDLSLADDFVFEAGKCYTFTISMYGTGDGVALTVTDAKGSDGRPQMPKRPVAINGTQVHNFSNRVKTMPCVSNVSTAAEKSPVSGAGVPLKDRAPWDLVNSFTLNGAGEQGIATDGNFIYTSCWNGNPGYDFGKYNMDGTFVEGFNITGVSGIRDLTYDGTYFYGGNGGATLYTLDLANKALVNTTSTGVSAIRHCSYDPANQGFWVGNWSNCKLIDMAGSVIQDGPTPSSAYGSGYFTDENGDAHLYLFCQPNSDAKVYDYNITTGSYGSTPVFDFAACPGYYDGISGGAFVGEYDGKVCFFGNCQQDPNLVGIYELAAGVTPPVPPTPTGDILGAVVFRDGEYLGFTAENTYTDLAPEAVAHNYCVRVVYDGEMDGTYYSMSCPECVDVEVPAVTCEAPELLNGNYQWNTSDDFGAMISWGEEVEPVAEWLYYDDGTVTSAIGAGGTLYWGVMFPSSVMAAYSGTSMTTAALFDYAAGAYTINIYYGGASAPQTLVHTQNFTLTGSNDWYELVLSAPLPIDPAQNLWVTFYNSGADYPGAVCANTGDANGRWVSEDGSAWSDLASFGLDYTFMVRAYVTNAAKGGEVVALPAFEGGKSEGGLSAINVEPRETMAPAARDLALESYKVYRSTTNSNYELIATVPAVAGQGHYEYYDQIGIGTYYYQVTAYYTGTSGECESEPAMSELNPSNNYVIVDVTSVGEGASATRLYPNPTNGNVTIEAAGMNHITVVSALGQVVYDSNIDSDNVVLNMAQYNAGVYMVRIATENGVSVKRVTVVR